MQTLSAQLTMGYGRDFDQANPFHTIRFVEAFPAQEIVYALSGQLSWTHFSEYLTELPPRELLASKLHEAIRVAREQLALRNE